MTSSPDADMTSVAPDEQADPSPASVLNGLSAVDLQSLLAAQAGGSGSLDLMSLLATQAGGAGGPPDDPMGLMLRWLEMRNAAQSAPADTEPSEEELEIQHREELEERRARQEQRRAQLRDLKHLIQSLYGELDQLRTRNDALAAGLGACYLCFGEDAACPECGGRGGPGALMPDPAAFRHFVAPAVNRVRARRAKYANGALPQTEKEESSIGNRHSPLSTDPPSPEPLT